MTKKTNALIFRFGLNTFWKSKNVNNTLFVDNIQLENIVSQQLQKNRLHFLKLDYKYNTLIVFVYNQPELSYIIKKQIVRFYREYADIAIIVIKFGLSKYLVKKILKKSGVLKKQKIKYTLKINSKKLFEIIFFRLLKINLLYLLKFFKNIWYSKLGLLLECLFFLYRDKFEIRFLNSFSSKSYKKRFRKQNGVLRFKLFSIGLENMIFLKCGLRLNIYLDNIFLNKNIFTKENVLKKKFKKKLKKKDSRFILYNLFVGLTYQNSEIISNYLSVLIKNDKNHYRILKRFTSELENYFYSNIVRLYGFQLWVTGKLTGKMRKSKYSYKLGVVHLRKLNLSLDYSLSLSYTKFGIISIKIWIITREVN